MKRIVKTRRSLFVVFLMSSLSLGGLCQSSPSGQGGTSQPTRAQQVPLSGRQASSTVTSQQTAVGGGSTSTANTINTSISAQGNYQSSVLDPHATGNPLGLTLGDTIRRGLQFNLGTINGNNSLRQVRAQRLAALSVLRPELTASLSYTDQKSDLQAIGLSASTVPSFASLLPKVVGPYHYYDARGSASQSLFDRTALGNYRAAKELEQASDLSLKDARELVILAVSGEYLRNLSEVALVRSQEAQVQYAQASYDQALSQGRAGTKSRVDTQRSLVQLQTEQQRLSSNQADLAKEKLTLLRMIGVPLRTQVTFQEVLPFRQVATIPLDEAIRVAESERKDLQADAAQVRAAEQALRASRAEHLPSASVSGYYAIEGVNPNSGNGIFSVAGNVNIPIFDGGRTRSGIEQAQAALDERRAEYQDQEQAVELDLRTAYLDLDVATAQVKVAESNRNLALDTLKQSQDRFAEGVTDSVEVVQSTETLAAAERDYISSLYSHNVAKLSVARALGQLEQVAPTLLEVQ